MIPIIITQSNPIKITIKDFELEDKWRQEAYEKQHTRREDCSKSEYDADEFVASDKVENDYSQMGIVLDPQIEEDLYGQKERLKRNTSHLLIKEDKPKTIQQPIIKIVKTKLVKKKNKRKKIEEETILEEVATK